ncbi:unnamed protein product [Clavelina lepadiformis]|uniref:Small integral membrane protein 20 n=1 Tax=Clavelina lepadiformis TaxID=159417 RepID=A0ABP0G3Y2_CLALP
MVLLDKFLYQKQIKKPDLRVRSGFGRRTNGLLPVLGLVIAVGLAFYPIYILPLYHPERYQQVQEEARKGITQEEVQPGDMRVWSNPFEPKPDLDRKSE